MPITSITITRPLDAGLSLRDNGEMRDVVGFSAKRFGEAIITPDLESPVTTVAQARAYRERILAALPKGSTFNPLMTLCLTDRTTTSEIASATHHRDLITAVKLYPISATNNPALGVTSMSEIRPVLDMMEREGLPLFLVHDKIIDPTVDVFDQEKVFIHQVLLLLTRYHPELCIGFNATTKWGVHFAKVTPNVVATITAHHLLENCSALFRGGINPHNFCLPVLNREEHRQALLLAATSGDPKYFFGSDSAPQGRRNKEAACGRPGCFTAHAALELVATAFEEYRPEALIDGSFERFMSSNGRAFYKLDLNALEQNKETITLVRDSWRIRDDYEFGSDIVVPFWAGRTLEWRVKK
ncbi:MAG: dihydroorotase [Minisyncoccia bacterium]